MTKMTKKEATRQRAIQAEQARAVATARAATMASLGRSVATRQK
jgi:hypothetical protein